MAAAVKSAIAVKVITFGLTKSHLHLGEALSRLSELSNTMLVNLAALGAQL